MDNEIRLREENIDLFIKKRIKNAALILTDGGCFSRFRRKGLPLPRTANGVFLF